MVRSVLGSGIHLKAGVRRTLMIGLAIALVVTALLIFAVTQGFLPGIVIALVALIGMVVGVFSDRQRRDHSPRRRARKTAHREDPMPEPASVAKPSYHRR
jgi:uncharacterized membrane protein